jgi:DNA-binding NarL/FixJ family response regulator
MVSLLIVDDHEVVREGLLAALAKDPDLEVVGAVGTGHAALQAAVELRPDIALVDLRLPDLSGDEVCRRIKREVPQTAVIILSTYLDESLVSAALKAGASEYVTKAAGLPQLRCAIHRAGTGTSGVSEVESRQMVRRLDDIVAARMQGPVPTSRQIRVLQLTADGLTDAAIAKRLFISESTVRFHLQKLKNYFSARTKAELIAKSIRSGLFPRMPDDEPGATSEQ